MNLVTISDELLQKYREQDKEVMQEHDRPYMLLLRLKYKGKRVHFAVPLRSNISPSTPIEQYFPLPNRRTTKTRCHHGLHYIKMIPIKKQYVQKYHTQGDVFSRFIEAYIRQHEREIVERCQNYLDSYSSSERNLFSTDIDNLLVMLDTLV